MEFRLNLLKEIASFNGLANDHEMRVRAEMLPIDLIPLTRTFVGLESTQRAKGHLRSLRAARVNIRDDVIADELLQAISTSLTLEVSPEYHAPNSGPELQG